MTTINASDYSSADDLYAAITRAQWDSFAENDVPYIMNYAEQLTSGENVTNAVSDAQSTMASGFASARAGQSAQLEGMGAGLSDAQAANQKADMDRTETLSTVAAMNDAKTAAEDRDLSLLSGSYTGLADAS